MAVIFGGSSISHPPSQVGGDSRSYAAHFIEYAILAGLMAGTLRTIAPRWAIALVVLVAASLSAVYGVTDEFHQSFVPGRDANIYDIGFDTLGSLFGASAWIPVALARRASVSPRSA